MWADLRVCVLAMVVGAIPRSGLALTIQSGDGGVVTPWAAYRILAGSGEVETLRIEFAKIRLNSGVVVPEIYWITNAPKVYWIAEKEPVGGRGAAEWADSRRCPSFASITVGLEGEEGGTLPAPTIADHERVYEIQSLTPYRSNAPAAFARQVGPEGGPIALRVRGAADALASCWTADKPELK